MNMAEELGKLIGQRLKLLRHEKQLTQDQMGEKLHLSTSAYCKIEYGETDLTLSRLNQIAETFGMSPVELFGKIDGSVYNITNANSGTAIGIARDNSVAHMESNDDLRELVKANSRLIDLLSRQVETLEARLQNRENR